MKNWKIILLIICTFGIAYFILKSQAKKKATQVNKQLTVSHKIPFNINKFYSAVGGLENITSATATINSLKLVFKNEKLVDVNQLKSIDAKGVLKSANSYRMTFGDYAISLADTINQHIKNN
ncbi:PTS transporter subunit EIIB [Ureaplasma sp. ES3154-GEN]|uniref:PTS transporter subunit EIIB n=1 Tax=Ureaplasma sp. ES3154-GEN TaxID=2984844 RepID=UPI0021E7E1D6|nr:PTS transporter subunit EIIB [Ureaplasma sp. ES3154-GEN]MCV3743768.1 PTS transporter subunit EIIB [Ureaplasma sp. ES3154-GEN]